MIQTEMGSQLAAPFSCYNLNMELRSLGKFFRIWYPSVLLMIIIFIFSSAPADDSNRQSGLIINAITFLFPNLKDVESLVTIVRKIAHFTEYAILGFFIARAFKLSKASPWFSILACAIYAGSDELHQSFIPGRSAEVKDVVLDTVGATFGVLIYWLTHRK